MPLLLAKNVVLARAKEAGDATVYAISRRTGVSQSALSRLLSGESEPSLQTLWTFRRHYKLTVDEQVREVDSFPVARRSRPRRKTAGAIVEQPVRA
ncbi:helix-turn-helix domain-containing protein [Streptomyces sp. Midd1]|uniref:helix-turn-helix domain-containing protein n=1 Tax=Streptomyces sp. Midd3 TaxID=3161191 RepID=UPI0034DB2F2B